MPIAFEDVTYRYEPADPSTTALDGVSFTVEDGVFACAVGHTGSGKSTLVEHVNALKLPTAGRVAVNGIDTSDKSRRRELRRTVGYVMQYPEYQLFAETVADDVAFGPRNLGWDVRETDAAVRESLELVGLSYEDVAELSPFDLSGGQRRRAALAGVIATRPKVLVVDEPMAGLDPQGRNEILSILRELNARGTTLLMVSHSMDDVAEIADQVLVLQHGRLRFSGAPAEAFSQEELLSDAGLELPSAARLARSLAERGFVFENGMPLTVNALVAGIAKNLRGTGPDALPGGGSR